MLAVTADLPRSPDEVTSAWLSHALGFERPGVRVDSLDITRVIWGTATKVLLEATYSGPGSESLPTRLCLKGGLDERLASVSNNAIHAIEARFYGELRHRFATSAPRSFFAGVDPAESTGLILLEDLSADTTFVEPGDLLTPDQVAAGLAHQARWHAATWGATPQSLPGVEVGSITRKAAKLFYRADYWDNHFQQAGAPQYPAELQDPRLLHDALRGMWARDDAVTHCFQHGDAHLGNTFLRGDGDLGFIDWQCYCLGPWSYDVALFVSGALTVEDRRANERDLLDLYLDHLAGAGGPRLDPGEAWLEYVRHLPHGLIWTMTPAVMQPFERSRVMSERYVAAVLDHDALTAPTPSL